jgi:hypothetical protein
LAARTYPFRTDPRVWPMAFIGPPGGATTTRGRGGGPTAIRVAGREPAVGVEGPLLN